MSKEIYEQPRRYNAVGRISSDEVINWDIRLANALNCLGHDISPTEKYFKLLELGVIYVEEREKLDGLAVAIGKEIRRLHEERDNKRNLEKVYEARGLDGFVEWCKENKVDWAKFLEDYDLNHRTPLTSKSEQYKTFLDQITRETRMLVIDEVRRLAETANLIHDDDDWQLMKVVASRESYTANKRGLWQRPDNR